MQLSHAATTTSPPPADRYVDDAEAAEILSVSRSYLRQLRCKGGGPAFSSFGRSVRYSVANLLTWAASKSATSTSTREA